VENSAVYNGENDIITMNARKVLEIVIGKLSEKEEFLMKLEKAINPLLDDNDQVSTCFNE
jgi:transcription initiation factor TFIID subunit 1